MSDDVMCAIEILDGSGHLTLTWDPADEQGVAKAKAEFERLKAAGYAFFATPGEDEEEVVGWPRRGRPPAWTASGSLDVRANEAPVQVREFRPRAARTVAVRPMRGG